MTDTEKFFETLHTSAQCFKFITRSDSPLTKAYISFNNFNAVFCS